MTARIRVAHVALDLEAGGLERLVADTIRCTDASRFESHLVVLDFFGRYAEGLDRFATLHQAPPLPAWTMLRPSPLTRLFKSFAPDVVHSHSGVWYKASLAARHAGVRRVIHTEHGRARWPDPWADRLVDRLAAGRTDVVVAVSDAVARQISGSIVRDPGKICVIRNGVDTALFAPGAAHGVLRAELGLAVDVPMILSVGRFDPIKGYDVVIDACALLRSAWSGGPAPVVVLAGDGPERSALEERARQRGVADAVFFPGWRSDVVDLLRSCTLFTLGSRSEGTSVSLLEAMSTGARPVVTAVGGNPAVLGHDLAHCMVPPEQPQALADAWHAAISNPTRRAADASRARARVEAEYSLSAMVKGYERVYAGASC